MKKIILILLVFSFFVGNVFADEVSETQKELDNAERDLQNPTGGSPDRAVERVNRAQNENNKAEHDKECAEKGNCLEKSSYMIDVGELGPGISLAGKGGTTEKKVNWLLGTVIQKLMIALGSISVLVMTIGGGYMILNGGADEILNKGKTIFKAGIISMVVALSSYIIVSIVLFILYN